MVKSLADTELWEYFWRVLVNKPNRQKLEKHSFCWISFANELFSDFLEECVFCTGSLFISAECALIFNGTLAPIDPTGWLWWRRCLLPDLREFRPPRQPSASQSVSKLSLGGGVLWGHAHKVRLLIGMQWRNKFSLSYGNCPVSYSNSVRTNYTVVEQRDLY